MILCEYSRQPEHVAQPRNASKQHCVACLYNDEPNPVHNEDAGMQPLPCENVKKLFTLLDLCVSSLRRGHANLLGIVPILTGDRRREPDDRKTRPRQRKGELRETVGNTVAELCVCSGTADWARTRLLQNLRTACNLARSAFLPLC